jgi:prophage DNA circulation protein
VSVFDRLRTFRYLSPSGIEFTLEFDELTRTGGKKAPVAEYPSQDEGSVQDLGEITQTFPVTCYISGPDYDLTADRFNDALQEPGIGILKHPRWGDLPVIPESRSQTEQFVDGVGRAVFTIKFIHAKNNSFDFPSIRSAADLTTKAEAEDLNTAMVDNFAGDTISDSRLLSRLSTAMQQSLEGVQAAFSNLTNLVEGLKTSIDDTVSSIIRQLDDLVTAPADLLTALVELYTLPAELELSVEAKVDAYTALLTSISSIAAAQADKYAADLGMISACQTSVIVAAASSSTTEGAITTRGEAGRIIDKLNDLNDTYISSLEGFESTGDFIFPYNLNRQRELTLKSAITSLVDRALNLPMEKSVILDEDKTPILVCWEEYGGLDRLEEFIDFNNLVSDEILLIPAGREVIVYE